MHSVAKHTLKKEHRTDSFDAQGRDAAAFAEFAAIDLVSTANAIGRRNGRKLI